MKQSKQVNENQHIITYVTLHFLLFLMVQDNICESGIDSTKFFLKRKGQMENGRHEERRGM
jgi:hypothetical protein